LRALAWEVGSFDFQVLLFPLQASGSGPGEEADPASAALHLPLLRGIVEFDVGGPGDFKATEFMERYSLGPKTKGCAVGVELNGGVHFGFYLG